MSLRRYLILIPAMVFTLGSCLVPLQVAADESAVAEQIKSGEADFRHFCAPCHGQDARGGGPVAAELKTAPPSLRDIAKRRNGSFDPGEITKRIDGRDMPRAHGTPEMPIWGSLFRFIAQLSGALASDTEGVEKEAQKHIAALVKYLETIQDK
jgi:mono/diheme cytochrome c family protein